MEVAKCSAAILLLLLILLLSINLLLLLLLLPCATESGHRATGGPGCDPGPP
jgi:hypothetical protein